MRTLKKAIEITKSDKAFAMSVRSETRNPKGCHCACNK